MIIIFPPFIIDKKHKNTHIQKLKIKKLCIVSKTIFAQAYAQNLTVLQNIITKEKKSLKFFISTTHYNHNKEDY